uniref:Nicotinamide mononucleotide adenylyltransferase 1 n=1 Tax=Schistocephalus solidus TaxID=70667 RepID=A0A0X3P473_SCHSO
MISLDGGDKGPQRSGTSSDEQTRTERSNSKHPAGGELHQPDSTQSTSSSLTSLETVIALPRPPVEPPFAGLVSPTIPNISTPVLTTRSFCTLARSGFSEHTYNPHRRPKRTASRLKTSRSAEAFSSSTSLSSSPAEADVNGGILRPASSTSYSSTCSTCSSGVDQTDSLGNSCSSITIGSTSNSSTSHSPSSASKESLSSCCSSSSLPHSVSPSSSSSSPPIGAFESAPLATTAVTTTTTTAASAVSNFSPYFVPVCTAFSDRPAWSHRTVRSPSPRRESPISVTATEADSSLRQSVTVCMENPVVLKTSCCRYSCCGCCSWFKAPEPIVLVACGSFNPITTMHLRLMELARDAIEKTWSFPSQSSSGEAGSTSSGEPLDPARELCQAYLTQSPRRQTVVAGILSPVSDAYAKPGLAPVESRCRLARLACATTSDWLAVDTWEASQSDWSPTRLVFEHIQGRLNRLAELSPEEVDRLLTEGSSLARPETASPTTEKSKATPQKLHSSGELPGMASDVWLCERLLEAQNLADRPCSLRPCHCFHKENQKCQFSPSEAPQSGEACTIAGEPNASGRLPRARVKLVCGADLLQSFATPGLWSEEDMETLVRDFGIICISRPESHAARLLNELDVLARHEQNVILVTEWCQNGLSATLVRRALARGQSVRYLVPDAALEEIYAAGLYGARRRRLDNLAGTESAARRPRLSRPTADRSLRLEPRPDELVSQEELADKEKGEETSADLQPGH